MSVDLKDRYQTKKNLVFNFLTFLVNATIGIFIPPFLIKKLGVDAYGLIPVSMSITSVMLLVTVSINGTLSRFLSLDFEKNSVSANKTFNTAFFSLLILILVLLPLSIYFSFNASAFLSIPIRVLDDSKWLFLTVLIAFLINTFASLYNSIAYVKNRIDLRNGSVIISRLSTLVFLGLFFYLGFIKIHAFGIATLIATFLGLIYSYFTFKKLANEITISFKYFDSTQLRRMSSLGFWLIINQIGVLFFLQTDIIIVNHLKGAELSGVYATLLQWSFLIRTLVGIVSGILGPLVLSLFAKEQFERLKTITVFSTKILGLFTSFVSCIIIYFSRDILLIWLGVGYIQYQWLFILTIVHLGFNLSVSSIVNLNIAYNKVKVPGYVALGTGLLNVLVGYLLLKYSALGLYSIAIAGFISLSIKNLFFTPYYAAKIMNISRSTYFRPIYPSFLIVSGILILVVVYPSSHFQIAQSWLKLILHMGGFSLVLAAILFKVSLTDKDRQEISSLILSKVKK
jgi:O-antigen/teichoic acid export membrane protein